MSAVYDDSPEIEEPLALPKGWSSATLGELAGRDGVVVDGDWVESKDQDPDGNVRLIQLADIGDGSFQNKSHRFLTAETARRLNCSFLAEGDVLIARMASPLGRACIFPKLSQPAVTAVDVCIWRSGAIGIDPRWLMHTINSPQARHQILAEASGTTRQRISGGKLKQITLPVPPLSEQRRIAARVDELFAEIAEGEAALERARSGLDTWRRALLKAAVTGQLTRDWREAKKPTHSGHDLLNAIKTKRESTVPKFGRNRTMSEMVPVDAATLPQLPENWTWASIGEMFDVFTGSTPSRAQRAFWNGDIPWVSSGEVAFCRIKKTRECVTREGLGNSANRIHPPGTVLLAMIGEGKTRGQCAILDIAACNNQNAAAIRVSMTPIDPVFIYLVLQERYFRSRRESQGGNQPALNAQKVSSIPTPLPPLEEMAEIVRRISDALNEVEVAEHSYTDIDCLKMELRQSILKSAFEGRLVPQDPNDEPASVLLTRLRAEAPPSPRRVRGRKSAP